MFPSVDGGKICNSWRTFRAVPDTLNPPQLRRVNPSVTLRVWSASFTYIAMAVFFRYFVANYGKISNYHLCRKKINCFAPCHTLHTILLYMFQAMHQISAVLCLKQAWTLHRECGYLLSKIATMPVQITTVYRTCLFFYYLKTEVSEVAFANKCVCCALDHVVLHHIFLKAGTTC